MVWTGCNTLLCNQILLVAPQRKSDRPSLEPTLIASFERTWPSLRFPNNYLGDLCFFWSCIVINIDGIWCLYNDYPALSGISHLLVYTGLLGHGWCLSGQLAVRRVRQRPPNLLSGIKIQDNSRCCLTNALVLINNELSWFETEFRAKCKTCLAFHDVTHLISPLIKWPDLLCHFSQSSLIHYRPFWLRSGQLLYIPLSLSKINDEK